MTCTRRSLFALLAPVPSASFPAVALRTQENKRVRFYEDLVHGKVVAINFMFTSCATFCPRATANLLKVQHHLGPRLGRDVHMLSITVDPDTDTPQVLRRYAAAHRTDPGWLFLTGERADIDRIRRKLGVFDDDPDKTQHTGILTYGNEATGSWGAMPVIAEATVISRTLLRLAVPKS
jgi:protein SCO1/2